MCTGVNCYHGQGVRVIVMVEYMWLFLLLWWWKYRRSQVCSITDDMSKNNFKCSGSMCCKRSSSLGGRWYHHKPSLYMWFLWYHEPCEADGGVYNRTWRLPADRAVKAPTKPPLCPPTLGGTTHCWCSCTSDPHTFTHWWSRARPV